MSGHTIHDPVDVLVIGSGCAGSIISKTLAEAGVGVTCLEQGFEVVDQDNILFDQLNYSFF